MKRIIIILFASIVSLSACKKDLREPEMIIPPASIIFNGNISTISGTYSTYATGTTTPKGEGTVSIAITYSGDVKSLTFTTPTGTTINNLGTVTVTGGSYTFTRLVKNLRGVADAPLPTTGTSGSVILTVTATLGSGATVKRLYTINITG